MRRTEITVDISIAPDAGLKGSIPSISRSLLFNVTTEADKKERFGGLLDLMGSELLAVGETKPAVIRCWVELPTDLCSSGDKLDVWWGRDIGTAIVRDVVVWQGPFLGQAPTDERHHGET